MNLLFRWAFSFIAILILFYGLYFVFTHPIEQYGFRGFQFFLFIFIFCIFLYGIDLIRNQLT